MISENRKKGDFAEIHARAFLRRKGYVLLGKNYAYRGGELDIIAKAPTGEIVFTEVKSAWSKKNGTPESRVQNQKQFKLWRTACHYLYHHFSLEQKSRFDVIAIQFENGKLQFRHYENAFETKKTIPEC